MKILWFTWKDLKNPQAGGAEVINEAIAQRMVRDGLEVILVVAGFPGCVGEEVVDGYRIVRLGNRYSVYWKAYRHYKRNLVGWADLVIDEMNTVPFFCKFYVRERCVLLTYQLCREIWFYQLPLPFSLIGYLLEPLYLRLLRGMPVLTESESTRKDLSRYGFDPRKVRVFPVGIENSPLEALDFSHKYPRPTLLSLGALRPMKRTCDQIRAFEIAKKKIPDLQLKLAGPADSQYGRRVLLQIRRSPFAEDIEYLGKVTEEQKLELMRRCHAILVTSVKEGWGLIVTEANSQGTPAVVYDVDGLRDSVSHGKTGIVTGENTPGELASAVVSLLQDCAGCVRMSEEALRLSRQMTPERCYKGFFEGGILDER